MYNEATGFNYNELVSKNNKLEVENAQLRDQIFYMSRDIESLKSQLQYFIDAANRGLKIIAYKAVK